MSYGGVSAGIRAAQMIRQVVTTLKMTPPAEAASIPFVQEFIKEGEPAPNQVMTWSAEAMLDELVRVAAALRPPRTPEAKPLP